MQDAKQAGYNAGLRVHLGRIPPLGERCFLCGLGAEAQRFSVDRFLTWDGGTPGLLVTVTRSQSAHASVHGVPEGQTLHPYCACLELIFNPKAIRDSGATRQSWWRRALRWLGVQRG